MSAMTPFLGRGWSFPPTFSKGGAEVEMVSGVDDVHQAVQLILRTTPGERVMQDLFGCDLHHLMFAEIDRSLANKVERLVQNALLEHEARITVNKVSVSDGDRAEGLLLVSVTYTIRGTNSRYNLVYPFYLMEATLGGAGR